MNPEMIKNSITVATFTTAALTLCRLHIELYLAAVDARTSTLTQYWVWADGHAAVGLDDRGEPVCVFRNGRDEVRTVRAPLATALGAYGIEFEIGDLWAVARERGDVEFSAAVGEEYAKSTDEFSSVLGDAILRNEWAEVDYLVEREENARAKLAA